MSDVLIIPITALIICIVSIMIIMAIIFNIVNRDGGTKGISKNEYTSPSGVKRTAKKSREDYIV